MSRFITAFPDLYVTTTDSVAESNLQTLSLVTACLFGMNA
jgi:hypothetical protein